MSPCILAYYIVVISLKFLFIFWGPPVSVYYLGWPVPVSVTFCSLFLCFSMFTELVRFTAFWETLPVNTAQQSTSQGTKYCHQESDALYSVSGMMTVAQATGSIHWDNWWIDERQVVLVSSFNVNDMISLATDPVFASSVTRQWMLPWTASESIWSDLLNGSVMNGNWTSTLGFRRRDETESVAHCLRGKLRMAVMRSTSRVPGNPGDVGL